MPRYGADQLSNAWPWLLLGALAFYGSYLLAVSQLRTATDADPLLGAGGQLRGRAADDGHHHQVHDRYT